jgi:hypothetical protein
MAGFRLVLRDVVLHRPGDTVFVSPAVDKRQLPAEIAVAGRGFGRLPLERGRMPRVAAGAAAAPRAPEDVDQE